MTDPLLQSPVFCHAHSKRTGEPCGNYAVTGWTVCRMHGAGGGRRYEKVLKHFAAAYRATLSDHRLMDMREPIALFDLMLQRRAARAAELDTPGFRKEILRLLESDVPDVAGALELARRGVEEDRSLDATGDAAERLNGMQARAWKVSLDARQAIPAKELPGLMGAWLDVVKKHAPDQHGAIAADVLAMLRAGGMDAVGDDAEEGEVLEIPREASGEAA